MNFIKFNDPLWREQPLWQLYLSHDNALGYFDDNFVWVLFIPQYIFNTIVGGGGYSINFIGLKHFLTHFCVVFVLDLLFYFVGKFIGKSSFFKKRIFDKPFIFFIILRFIPIVGHFSVIFGGAYSKKENLKRDIVYLCVGCLMFLIVAHIWGALLSEMSWPKPTPWLSM